VKVLENVPRGHGKNEVSSHPYLGKLLNPEAKREDLTYHAPLSTEKRRASVWESIGFLEENKSLVYRSNNTNYHNCLIYFSRFDREKKNLKKPHNKIFVLNMSNIN